jgi:hypothetical protein
MRPLPSPLRVSALKKDPAFEASKWLELRFLIDVDEMKSLLAALDPVGIYLANSVSALGEGFVPHELFLEGYGQYVNSLKSGEVPESGVYRTLFSSSWTVNASHLYAVPVSDTQQLIRIERPVLQFQTHCMDYSSADDTFKSMVYGRDSILWGLQCSYPQIFQNHTTHQIDKVTDSDDFPNTRLFRALQNWLRLNTTPTPFIVGEGDKTHLINSPMRLGKQCFSWINQHPQLIAKKISVRF